MSNYKKCPQDIIDYFKKVIEKECYMPIEIKWVYTVNVKQKQLLKISKVSEQFVDLLNAELIVVFNEEYFDALEDVDKKILIEQELSKVEFNLEKGTIKISKPNLQTSVGLIKKYTYEKVERANDSEKLYAEQKDDKEKE